MARVPAEGRQKGRRFLDQQDRAPAGDQAAVKLAARRAVSKARILRAGRALRQRKSAHNACLMVHGADIWSKHDLFLYYSFLR